MASLERGRNIIFMITLYKDKNLFLQINFFSPFIFLQVLEVEDEMRVLLQENAITKKTLEKRLQKLTSAFTEIQHDLAGT